MSQGATGPFLTLYGPKTNPAQGLSFSQQAAQQYTAAQQNASQGLSLSQLAAQAHNQFNSAYNAYAQQGMNQQLANQPQIYHLGPRTHYMWVWNGLPMDIVDFARHAYGDTPEATHFILKYKDVI